MNAFVIMTLWVACLPACDENVRTASRETSETAEAVRRLSAEFESVQRSAFDIARKAKTEAERKAAMRAMPDRRKYAQRFLSLVSETTDEAAAVDALVWVVRNGFLTPEGHEHGHRNPKVHDLRKSCGEEALQPPANSQARGLFQRGLERARNTLLNHFSTNSHERL
jgi:hypothetical protein